MKAILLVVAMLACSCYSQVATGGYTPLAPADIQSDPLIQSLANFGAQYVVQRGIAAGKIPFSNANFNISSINSVSEQVVNGLNYNFNVTLYNAQTNITLTTVFIVYYIPASDTRRVTSYSYTVSPYYANPTPAPVPVPSSNSSQATNSTQVTTQPAAPYTPISASDIQSSALIQSLANFGAQYIVQLAQSAGNLPNSNSNFSTVTINSVSQQSSAGVNYLFNVTLINSDNSTTLYATYTINYQANNNSRQVRSASYSVAPYNVAPAQAPAFVAVPASEYQNSAPIQSLAAFGAQYTIQQAIARASIPSNETNFSISSFNEVARQATNPVNYRFNVNLVNPSNTIELVAAYIVSYQPTSGARQVLAANYAVVPRNA